MPTANRNKPDRTPSPREARQAAATELAGNIKNAGDRDRLLRLLTELAVSPDAPFEGVADDG